MKDGKFKNLIIETYNKSQDCNLFGLLYGAVSTCGLHDISDITEYVAVAYPDMLHLKSRLTDTEADIYSWELEDFKVKSSENTIYIKLRNKPEIAFMY